MSQHAVIVLPERPDGHFLALAMDAREFFESRGYKTSVRFGTDGFDDDLTPVDGAALPAVCLTLSDYPPPNPVAT